ncbi:MAG: hypothetical protein NC084_07530 [Bacteroides sp.]|nr:hypothetical protein [Eubacterium sp.]MCM1417515.1 hypothetical protein [Roseburia sp.]MCM1462550.1 hypothetical protein [Bacteroides sp.]
MKFSKAIAAGVAAAAVASTLAVTASAADAFDAYIGFQTTVYSFRNAWDDSGYGAESGYHDNFIVWGSGDAPEETFPDYEDNWDYDVAGYLLDATYEDVTVDGNGTYTVSASDIDWALDKASDFNLIFVSTDAPNDGSIVCTEAKIIVDGEVVKTIENPICDETQSHFNISLANTWNNDIGGYGLAYPTESLAVEFTIEGFDDDADEGNITEDEAPAAEETPAAEEAPATTEAPVAGDTATATASSTKGSPDTGVEDVALIGGLAIVAGAAIALTRKRK